MKTIKIIFLSLFFTIMIGSCTQDFENPNQPSDQQVLSTKNGLLTAITGLNQNFSNNTLSPIIETVGFTTRELGYNSTFFSPMELVAGGAELSNENGAITRLWSNLLRDKGVAEAILANVDNVTMDPATKSGIKAYAKFFKAMTLGYLIQNFEKAPINNQADGKAVFSDRASVLAECINLLVSAKSDITTTPASAEFNNILPNLSMPNMINAYLARYNLFAGNYQAAIDAANTVNLTVKSFWIYTGANKNPGWVLTLSTPLGAKPQDDFGLTGAYIPESGDGRKAFYLASSSAVEVPALGGHALENALGFFTTTATSIPVYLPGEMLLIKAEAYAKLQVPNFPDAVINLNLVRQKTTDVFGVNAGLGAWTGNAADQTDILNEVYKNRCIELYLSGMRLEDSRRIHNTFVPSAAVNYSNERNRNYYPYPFGERVNNPNCPTDPSI